MGTIELQNLIQQCSIDVQNMIYNIPEPSNNQCHIIQFHGSRHDLQLNSRSSQCHIYSSMINNRVPGPVSVISSFIDVLNISDNINWNLSLFHVKFY